MKVIFIEGADGVGKTTLINNLPETSEVLKTKLPTPYINNKIKNENYSLKDMFILNFIDQCGELTKFGLLSDYKIVKTIIVDRSPLSNIMYYYNRLDNNTIRFYFNLFHRIIDKTLDYEFYILHGKKFKKQIEDKFEYEFEVIQNRYTNYKQILQELNIPYIVSPNEKIRLISNKRNYEEVVEKLIY